MRKSGPQYGGKNPSNRMATKPTNGNPDRLSPRHREDSAVEPFLEFGFDPDHAKPRGRSRALPFFAQHTHAGQYRNLLGLARAKDSLVICQPFYTTKKLGDGTGPGLRMSRNIIGRLDAG